MPQPPIADSERRLARTAAVLSWASLLLGLFAALAPKLLLRAFALGGEAPALAGARFFAQLAGAGLIALAASLRRTARAPREQRTGFGPLLWMLGSSTLLPLVALWRGGVPGDASQPLRLLAAGAGLLWLGLGIVYWQSAPGVNLGAAPGALPEAEPAKKPVTLGVRAAAAPVVLAEAESTPLTASASGH